MADAGRFGDAPGMTDATDVSLVAYTDADLELALACELDPVAMRYLGGPREEEAIRKVHGKRLLVPTEGGIWKTVLADGDRVGTIGVWRSDYDDPVWETGWMLLPSHHGHGIATRALAQLIELARAEGAYESLHAYPGRDNEASNALCRRAGFSLVGPWDGEYAGGPFAGNHWRIDL